MKIENENGKANIYSPYNPNFVKAIKLIGGQDGMVRKNVGAFQKML